MYLSEFASQHQQPRSGERVSAQYRTHALVWAINKPRPGRHPCTSPGACSARVFSIYYGWVIRKSFGDFEPGPPPPSIVTQTEKQSEGGKGGPGGKYLHEINPLPRAGTYVPVSTPAGSLVIADHEVRIGYGPRRVRIRLHRAPDPPIVVHYSAPKDGMASPGGPARFVMLFLMTCHDDTLRFMSQDQRKAKSVTVERLRTQGPTQIGRALGPPRRRAVMRHG